MRVELARHSVQEQLRERAVVALDLAPRTRSERELFVQVLNSARAHLDLRRAAGENTPQSGLESLQRYLFSAEAVPAGLRNR